MIEVPLVVTAIITMVAAEMLGPLNRYGDDFERISSFTYVLFTMWLIPFRLSGNSHMMQIMIDLDELIQDVGDILDYNKNARSTFLISVSQICIYLLRMLCIWFPINNANQSMPSEKIFQVVYSDAQAIIFTSIYCYSIIILRVRFKWVNKVLKEIKMLNSWEYKI
ncbi:Gustatory receptor 67 [Operophtera brumata]|uniref:Gustatory receptor 67 n=1 Tax=Operophtera brumata TaxID=104452 RepID=A0A0L7K4F2_OPEBR|nr:Gustatory receptor 67 [Operophtera brumata]